MNRFIFEGLTIHHKINKRMKHSYISINSEAEVLLKTPDVSKNFIYNLLQSKKSWINKQLLLAQDNKAITMNLEDEVILFGEVYSIDAPEATLLREKLKKIEINSQIKIHKAYNTFYKEYAHSYITLRVEYFAKVMEQAYEKIKYRKMKSRWGSCSSVKTLTFNTELMKIKKELIDYVIVHELAHLTHMNHSREFHALVDFYLPNSKVYKNELRHTKIATF